MPTITPIPTKNRKWNHKLSTQYEIGFDQIQYRDTCQRKKWIVAYRMGEWLFGFYFWEEGFDMLALSWKTADEGFFEMVALSWKNLLLCGTNR